MGIYDQRKSNGNNGVPVWFMRQAGRYHSHYQGIRQKSDFMSMCKTPELAEEITLGPIQDFNFDAAILFSDLLFPLEQLGMGLNYDAGPPQLSFHLETLNDVERLHVTQESHEFYAFQAQALERLRKSLPAHVDLLGFSGAPFTLYTYASCGAHAGGLIPAKTGLYDGRYSKFMKKLLPVLQEQLILQAKSKADGLCLFDTAAGELSLKDFKEYALPALRELIVSIKNECPQIKITYYSKHTHFGYHKLLKDLPIDVLGIDWRNHLPLALTELSDHFYIQGNIDPVWLHLSWDDLKKNLEGLKSQLHGVPMDRWIFGLGHGVLPKTPEENVRRTVEWVHENLKLS